MRNENEMMRTMSMQELENVNGGWIQGILTFIGGAILGDILLDPVGAINAFRDGMEKAMVGHN